MPKMSSQVDHSAYSEGSNSENEDEHGRSISIGERKVLRKMITSHMSLNKANEAVKHIEKQLRHFYQRYLDQKEHMNQIRYSYFKELQTLKEMMYRAKKFPETFECMDIQYFSIIDALDERNRELMNAKLEDVKNHFNEKLLDLYKTNQVLDHQIRIFERIEETGNIGIKLSEMNCEDIVVKLQIVENDPNTIWKCIQKYFGYGFFNVMIEKEFGINPYTHEEIVHNFIGQVTGVKENALEKLRRIEEVTESRYKDIKNKFLDYENHIQLIETRHTQDVKVLKENLDSVSSNLIV